ncbi:MAG: SUF system NifU family Fe-S cluster assembly protein [Polyangiaceae bacterium]|nr:SUF system NifU family Fe-S cluster assembly protein [Polyangiaceae bacterium]
MTPEVAKLYQALILEESAHPQNRGPLAAATHNASKHNALCGDQVTLHLVLEGDRINQATFEGDGCAMLLASASLLTEAVRGVPSADATALVDIIRRLVQPEGASEAERARLGKLTALEGVRNVPARRRCVTLPWETLDAALLEHG